MQPLKIISILREKHGKEKFKNSKYGTRVVLIIIELFSSGFGQVEMCDFIDCAIEISIILT